MDQKLGIVGLSGKQLLGVEIRNHIAGTRVDVEMVERYVKSPAIMNKLHAALSSLQALLNLLLINPH